MNAQDLEQRARELLAAEYERDGKTGSAHHIRTQPLLPNKARAVRAVAAALRQHPAPVGLEQFRDACYFMKAHGNLQRCVEADRLLSIIDNAGKVEPACEVRLWDSQWVNIVNAPEVLDASDREEAVNIAVRMTERAIAQNVASSNLPPAPPQPAPVVDDAMVERYLTAVHEHLGGLPSEQWDRDREDGGSTLRRIARIGLTAALAREQPVPVTASA